MGGGVTQPPPIQTKNKKEKGEIRRGEESQNKKRWERRCVEVKRREGQGERKRGKAKMKPKKKREEEPVPVRFWLPNGKTARGRGFLLLWLFLSKGHSMAMGSALLVRLVHDSLD